MSIKSARIVSNGEGQIYHFETFDSMDERMHRGSKLWQILPCLGVALLCIPFGVMLGWPSPTYLELLSEESPLPISIVQSPMIAGFLMFGNIIATPFSGWSLYGSKYAILLSLIAMSIGWTLIWQATDIYYLLGGRLIIGLGNGYAVGHVKTYINEMSEGNLASILTRLVNIFMIIGVVLSYIIGIFTNFRSFPPIIVAVTIAIFSIIFFVPHTPSEYVFFKKLRQAKKMLRRLKPAANPEIELAILKGKVVEPHLSIIAVFRESSLRKNLFILILTTFIQQFSGAPATIVYCQFIFYYLYVPSPEICAITYSLIFLFCNILSTFYLNRFPKKTVLFISCFFSLLSLCATVCAIYLNLKEYWEFIPLVTMLAYITSHTSGLGAVPFTFSEYLFPKNARRSISQLQIMFFSIFAVIITKLFQVFYSAFEFYAIFALFASIAAFGCIFILIAIPTKPYQQ
ncbi:PREDICTED: facilitated trehalose transporter Tret1-like [Nicrophorus vespilloides]|uniref:Facilitated trehalose transporter Tret1-like n=1 Tax=Nicrophorus vespilloides TaxID=110193 RepID=A0ABM1N1V6_NICVS|nr:PREDICTED: facilitated trehalose transporter Tret1-like [Nicrophorus vespilloides]